MMFTIRSHYESREVTSPNSEIVILWLMKAQQTRSKGPPQTFTSNTSSMDQVMPLTQTLFSPLSSTGSPLASLAPHCSDSTRLQKHMRDIMIRMFVPEGEQHRTEQPQKLAWRSQMKRPLLAGRKDIAVQRTITRGWQCIRTECVTVSHWRVAGTGSQDVSSID